VKKVLVLSLVLLAMAPFAESACNTIDILDEVVGPFYVGVGANFQLSAYGGTAPYTWSTYAGALPPGLSLSSSGAITGTPTTADDYFWCVTVTDSVGCHVTKCFFVSVF